MEHDWTFQFSWGGKTDMEESWDSTCSGVPEPAGTSWREPMSTSLHSSAFSDIMPLAWNRLLYEYVGYTYGQVLQIRVLPFP